MLCIRFLQGMGIDATPDPPSLSFSFAPKLKLLLEDEQKFKLGGC